MWPEAVWTGQEVILIGGTNDGRGRPAGGVTDIRFTPPDLGGLVLITPGAGGQATTPSGDTWVTIPAGVVDRQSVF